MIDPGRNSGSEPACAETILRLFWNEKFGADPLNHFDSNYQPAQFQVWRAICYLQFVICHRAEGAPSPAPKTGRRAVESP
jgi:hypothetical protein